MTKYNHRQGHSINCRGARGYLDEVDVCSQVNKYVREYLKQVGECGVDCTSTCSGINSDLYHGVSKNNSNKAEYFISIHANAGGGTGSEVWVHPNTSQENKNKANQVCNKLEILGFKKRGVKTSVGLYELNRTNNKAMIIELFFLDNKNDCDKYKAIGPQRIAKAIVEGLTGKSISEQKPSNKLYRVQVGAFSQKSNAENLKKELEKKGYKPYITEN